MESSTSIGNMLTETLAPESAPHGYLLRRDELPYRHVYEILMDIISPVSMMILPLGIVFNIINILVFCRINPKDTVTVSLLLLSMSDLAYLAFVSIHYIVVFVDYIFEFRRGVNIEWGFNEIILRYPFYWYASTFYETSMLITVYMSVVRCACVAMPLKFKTSFTVFRTIITCCCLSVVSCLLRVPTYLVNQIRRVFDPVTNTTKFDYYDFDDNGLADRMYDIINWNIIPITSFTVVSITTIILRYKLFASLKFRKSATPIADHSEASKDETSTNICQQYPSIDTDQVPRNDTTTKESKATSTMSSKEVQLARSVVFIAAVFITCQIPYVVSSVVRQLDHRFDLPEYVSNRIMFPLYQHLYAAAQAVSKMFAFINASFNIFVYYFVNSKYRQELRNLCFRSMKRK